MIVIAMIECIDWNVLIVLNVLNVMIELIELIGMNVNVLNEMNVNVNVNVLN